MIAGGLSVHIMSFISSKNSFNFHSSILWLTESYALLRSKNATKLPTFLLFLLMSVQINLYKWISQPIPLINPIWLLTIYFSSTSWILFCITLSNSLTRLELIAIGLVFLVDGGFESSLINNINLDVKCIEFLPFISSSIIYCHVSSCLSTSSSSSLIVYSGNLSQVHALIGICFIAFTISSVFISIIFFLITFYLQ